MPSNEPSASTPPGGEVLLYEAPDGQVRVDVRLERETVWLSLTQMAELFGRDKSVISRHLRTVFASGELEREAVVAKNATTAADGKTYQVEFFNLDAILSVGYRVNSKRGTQFRIWATRTLRDHLVRGYTFNEHRLAERGLLEARQTLDLLARTLQNQSLVDETGRAVLDLIVSYADTWRLLLEYDEDRLPLPPGVRPSSGVLGYDQASRAIADFKRELLVRNEATPLFGNPRGEALDGILASLEQTMFGDALYRSREEKAAHLLYFIVKDHPFTDGNKRIGSFLFLLYLRQEGVTHRLTPEGLTALTLLLAESASSNKDLMIRLIINLLVEPAT
ncbi:RhuM family protein [Nitrospira sp. T9]|uniref:RhuM family protein n=1 Tax=unclassified Nitrospira TaxID=2652172 RepID=UPI003F98ADD6